MLRECTTVVLLKRFATVDEVAAMVTWMASELVFPRMAALGVWMAVWEGDLLAKAGRPGRGLRDISPSASPGRP
jgi:hypothetical protein